MAALYVLTIINVCLAKLVRYGLFFFKKMVLSKLCAKHNT
jgi:hypothetical protein